MTNNELLLAISDMMDKKLDARLLPIETDMKDMKADMQNMKADMQSMKADMQHMKADMKHMQTDIQHMKTDIKNIEERVTTIELHLENETDKNIALLAENCIPAARKYEKETEKIEAMQDDIHIMKKVITEHSIELQNIS